MLALSQMWPGHCKCEIIWWGHLWSVAVRLWLEQLLISHSTPFKIVLSVNSLLRVFKRFWKLLSPEFYHHHHEQSPSWSVVVSTRCFQCSRSWVYFPAELRPRLRGWRSASRVHSQVWWGRPGGRLQSLGSPLMETLSALVMYPS